MLIDVAPQITRDTHNIGEGRIQVVNHAGDQARDIREVPLEWVEQAQKRLYYNSAISSAVLLWAHPSTSIRATSKNKYDFPLMKE